MPSLSEFSKKFEPKKKPEQQTVNSQTNVDEQLAQTYQKMAGKSQDELMNELFKEGARLKQNGNFDAQALIKAVEGMGGMLGEEQKQKMIQLINKLK